MIFRGWRPYLVTLSPKPQCMISIDINPTVLSLEARSIPFQDLTSSWGTNIAAPPLLSLEIQARHKEDLLLYEGPALRLLR